MRELKIKNSSSKRFVEVDIWEFGRLSYRYSSQVWSEKLGWLFWNQSKNGYKYNEAHVRLNAGGILMLQVRDRVSRNVQFQLAVEFTRGAL